MFYTTKSQKQNIADTWESLKKSNFSNLVSNIEKCIEEKKSKEDIKVASILIQSLDKCSQSAEDFSTDTAPSLNLRPHLEDTTTSSCSAVSSGKCDDPSCKDKTARSIAKPLIEQKDRKGHGKGISALTNALLKETPGRQRKEQSHKDRSNISSLKVSNRRPSPGRLSTDAPSQVSKRNVGVRKNVTSIKAISRKRSPKEPTPMDAEASNNTKANDFRSNGVGCKESMSRPKFKEPHRLAAPPPTQDDGDWFFSEGW